jgi:hypothetical protein
LSEQQPSIGRIVHYVASNGAHLAADVCAIKDDGSVSLFIKDNVLQRAYFKQGVVFDEQAKVGTWHWPERA